MSEDNKFNNVSLIQLSNYVRPEIQESRYREWVLNGENNSFFDYIIDRYNGSPTNESIINVYDKLLFGRGIRLEGEDIPYEGLYEIFQPREIRKCLTDYKLFGMYSMQLVRSVGGGIAAIEHIPINKLGMEKANDKGEIDAVYYCNDWHRSMVKKPKRIPMFKGKMTDKLMVKVVKPYQAGMYYYSNPDYLAGLQYAHIEEEISNFSINHIQNGLSFGYIININNGSNIQPEQKEEIERLIKQKLTGSPNAGKFILSFNDSKEFEITVTRLEVNDAHNQWESLREDAKYQILTAHGVTSPLLFGMPSATGFGSNADELNVASKLLQDYQITPKQEFFIDELKLLLELNGLETNLEFIPLRESYTLEDEQENENQEEENAIEDENVQDEDAQNLGLSEDTELSCKHVDLEALFEKGEDLDLDEYELVDERAVDDITITEKSLNTVFQFAKPPRNNPFARSS